MFTLSIFKNTSEDETQEIEAISMYQDTVEITDSSGITFDNDDGLVGLTVFNNNGSESIQMSVEQARYVLVALGKAIQEVEGY